jgi:hypothetical protein
LLAKEKIALVWGEEGVEGVEGLEGRLCIENSIFGYGAISGQQVTRPCSSNKVFLN